MTQLVSAPLTSKQATGLSTNLDAGLPWPPSWDAHRGSDPVSSVLSDTQPIDEPRLSKSAALVTGPNDTFYNRILIEPARLEMGNLLSNQTRPVSIWNGFLTTKVLESVQRFNDPGITFSQPVEAPYLMRPIQELTYVLAITTDGPAVIDASYTWTVEGVEYSAVVVGRRVVVFPYGPNWRTPVTETLEWLTDVLRAYDGTEQRRSLRTKARRTFSYQIGITRNEASRLDNLLWGWQNRTYALPVWTDKGRLIGEHVQGDTILNVATSHYSFTPGGMAILYRDVTDFEVVEIDSVSPTAISLKRPIERTWPKNAVVFPCVLGHLPTQLPTLRHSSNALTSTVTFTCNPGDTDPFTPAAAAPVTYDGREVILRQPNWSGPLDNTFEYMFNTLDQQTGSIMWDTTEEWPRVTRRYPWLLKNRDQILDYRQMLGRLNGRAKTLYVPTWHDDFIVTREIGAADTAIEVLSNEFRTMIGVDPARDRVMIRLTNGEVFFRQIVGISVSGENTLLSLNESLGKPVPLDKVHMVHLLMRSRMAADRVELSWRSNEVVTVDNTFITVKE